MAVTPIYSEREVAHCVDMYLALNDEVFMPTSRDAALQRLWAHVRLKHFVRCLRHNGKIIAWIYAAPMQHEHADYNVLQQLYYASDQTGVMAARAVVTLHEALYKEACRGDYRYAVSLGSHFDERNVFARILERAGWTRRGFAAVREVPRGAPNAGRP